MDIGVTEIIGVIIILIIAVVILTTLSETADFSNVEKKDIIAKAIILSFFLDD